MKELIINALQAAGKPTEGKSDAELMDAYNQMKAEEAIAKKKGDEEMNPETGKPKKKSRPPITKRCQRGRRNSPIAWTSFSTA